MNEDTIVALSTPDGRGGMAIVRLSGSSAVRIALKIFYPPSGRPFSELPTHKAIHGFIVDPLDKRYIDEVVCTAMLKPRSYTGEDVVEISCHGGVGPVETIIELCVGGGAMPAEPGEFTRRAFLNGHIDLSQAEAVADIIDSRSKAGLSAAMEQLRGKLSQEATHLSEELTQCLTIIEATVDFPEEDIPPLEVKGLKIRVEAVRTRIEKLMDSYRTARIAKEGVKVVIAGKPNVGKSSLLNVLLADDRAIVTPLPGTTRDSIEEVVVINNLHYRLTDTAGIRKNGDLAEKMGVQRALRLLKEADLCLMVLDASRELDDEDRMVMEATAGRPTLTVINKIDLPLKWDPGQPHTAGLPGKPIKVSAKKEWGFEELKKAMTKNAEKDPTEGAVITRMRHKVALSKAAECLDRTLKAIEERMSPEFPAADIYEARSNVDSIRGVGCSTDILDRVFEQFCIGK